MIENMALAAWELRYVLAFIFGALTLAVVAEKKGWIK